MIGKNWKQPKYLLIVGRINKLCYFHITVYCKALKKNECKNMEESATFVKYKKPDQQIFIYMKLYRDKTNLR